MTRSLTPEEIQQLPVAERLRLMDEIWDSLNEERSDPVLSEWQARLLHSRLEAFEADQTRGAPWDEVKRRILSRS